MRTPICSAPGSIPNADRIASDLYITSPRPPDPPPSLRVVRGDQFAVPLHSAKACLLLVPVDVPQGTRYEEVTLERAALGVFSDAEVVDRGIELGVLEHVD